MIDNTAINPRMEKTTTFITVCGNLFVIFSIIYFKQLHTPTNYLILSLAVADLLVGIVVFPLSMEFSFISCIYHDDFFCRVRAIFEVSLCTSSILNLCCISIDRYYAVCQPLTYKAKISDHVVGIMILVSWSVAVLIAVGFVIAGMNHEKCAEACLIDTLMANTIGLIFSFYLPVIVILSIYLKIFIVAQRQALSIQSTSSHGTKSNVSKMERKATKTLSTVMGFFLICWLPFFICTTVISFSPATLPIPLIELFNWLALSNSTINPFIYAFFYSWFRSAFRMIVSGKIIQGDFTDAKLL
ncbi:trace amine-associated receptor 4-like [Aulostomus maculatus]